MSTINHGLVDPIVGAGILYLSTINNVIVDPIVVAEILYLPTINNVIVDPIVVAEILYLSTINHVLIDPTDAAEILYLSTMFEPICVTSEQIALHDDLIATWLQSWTSRFMLLHLIAMHCIDQAHRGSYLDCGVPELMFDGSRGRMMVI